MRIGHRFVSFAAVLFLSSLAGQYMQAQSLKAQSPQTHSSQAEDGFPYVAYVVADDVYVRSGPGRDYYPTQKLGKTDSVEVYRHDPGGWLAIRPPEGSFTWVSSRFVEPTEKGIGKVTEENTVARVGSQFSSIRDVIQVRLEKGELVQILEAANNGGQTWYKISPPSGEFRWISADYVDRRPPNDGVSEPRSEQDLAIHERPAAQPVEYAQEQVEEVKIEPAPTIASSQPGGVVEATAPSAAVQSAVRQTSAEAPIAVRSTAGAIQPASTLDGTADLSGS